MSNELREALAVFVGQPIARNTLLVRLRVDSVWKGDLGGEVVMPTGAEATPDGGIRSSTCDMSFSTEYVYLVFAYGKTLETMKARACTFTAPLQYTQLSDVLDRLVQRRRPSPLVSTKQWVVVVGDVGTPGLIEWREGMTVADAVKLAGGRVPVRHPEFAHLARSSKVIRWRKTRDEYSALPTTPLLPDDELFIAGDIQRGQRDTSRHHRLARLAADVGACKHLMPPRLPASVGRQGGCNMKLIDTITVQHLGTERSIMLYVGDLACLPAHEAVDLLVVSAFANDYFATPRSLIGALHRTGISVADLARDKEVDLRTFSSCWLSRPVATPGTHFKRILCFEPMYRGRAPEVVGDIFRSIVLFTAGTPPISTIAMPLVASGDQGEPAEAMLESLVDAAMHWLSAGLTLDRIKVVLRDSAETASLRETFARVKRRHTEAGPAPKSPAHRYDVFVSYSHKDQPAADELVAGLMARRASLRVFLDRLELCTGAAWQQHIFESLDSSRKVVCVFSPHYIASKVCKEEFNIALMRHRESDSGVLLPLYLRSAELPGYMRMLQYEDAREGAVSRIAAASEKLAAKL